MPPMGPAPFAGSPGGVAASHRRFPSLATPGNDPETSDNPHFLYSKIFQLFRVKSSLQRIICVRCNIFRHYFASRMCYTSCMHIHHRAFSLVELSIVLVILGLLTGGILGGQSLIRAAELRSVATEYNRYTAAAQTFRDKYFAIPGDMRNAVSFWGAADGGDGTGADCYSAVSTSAATCNGNGNGSVEAFNTTVSMEPFRFWQQLASAGLIEGTYTGALNGGTYASSARYAASGINIPRSKLSNAAWYTETVGYQDGTLWGWPGDYGTPLFFGAVEPTDITEAAAIKPEEAWNIDTKMDDGKPALGSVRTARTDSDCNSTTTAASAASAEYLLTQTGTTCYLLLNMKI